MNAAGVRGSLTRAIALHATHQYHGAVPSERHGHLYRIEVTVHRMSGTPGMPVVDLATLDTVLTSALAEPLAGRHLNEVIPEFASGEHQPTCEAFAAWCWRRVSPRLPAGVQLERVRVAEDATLWADCTGVE